jgi:hypothetical protein
MAVTTDDSKLMQPIIIEPGVVASSPSDLVEIILRETNRQVADKAIEDDSGRDEFAVSSDALNYRRLGWRYAEELGKGIFPEDLANQVREELCARRGYDLFDFESVLLVVAGRARLPFGWSALEFARRLALRNPIRLLNPQLADKPIPKIIANLAYNLQIIQGEKQILLPIDQLRSFLNTRKIVVSGTVHRLIEAKILEAVDVSFHTGKAREFRFCGKQGEHFEFENSGN